MDEFDMLKQTPEGMAFLANAAFGKCDPDVFGGDGTCKERHFPKAEPIDDLETINDCHIVIDGTLPRYEDLDEQRRYFAETAEELEDALYHSLPGGLYDALLVEMMRRKVSLFAVRL